MFKGGKGLRRIKKRQFFSFLCLDIFGWVGWGRGFDPSLNLLRHFCGWVWTFSKTSGEGGSKKLFYNFYYMSKQKQISVSRMSSLSRAIVFQFPWILCFILVYQSNTADVPAPVHTIEEQGEIFAFSKGCLVVRYWTGCNKIPLNKENPNYTGLCLPALAWI